MTRASESGRSAGAGSGQGAGTMASVAAHAALLNLPFVAALGFFEYLHPFLQTLVVGALLFIVPGIAWTDRRQGDAFVILFRGVMKSLAASVVVWLVLLPLPGPTSRAGFLVALMVITNAGFWWGSRRGWYEARPFSAPLPRMVLVVAMLFYVQSYLGALHFVPALEDHDMEVQGTAYGLMHEFEPTMVTNRHTRYFFAHPLLLHFWIAESALISNDLDDLRHYHESSLGIVGHEDQYPEVWKAGYDRFLEKPVLQATRNPNLFLAVFALFPLAFLVFRLCGSRVAAVGACVAYATLPEVYVRSSYGGYFAVTNFLITSGTYFYLQATDLLPKRPGTPECVEPTTPARSAYLSSFLGAMSDQKAILLAFAVPAFAVVRVLLDWGQVFVGGIKSIVSRLLARRDFMIAFWLGVAFIAGWVTYAVYGLSVATEAFIQDHLKDHLVRRMKLNDVNLYAEAKGEFVYPSILALWREFASHMGWIITGFWAAAMAWSAGRIKGAHGVFLLWVLIGAVGFSLVDWRQTKHLAHILPALMILAGAFWGSLSDRLKAPAAAIAVVGIAWNVYRVGLVMQDFEYIKPLPIW